MTVKMKILFIYSFVVLPLCTSPSPFLERGLGGEVWPRRLMILQNR